MLTPEWPLKRPPYKGVNSVSKALTNICVTKCSLPGSLFFFFFFECHRISSEHWLALVRPTWLRVHSFKLMCNAKRPKSRKEGFYTWTQTNLWTSCTGSDALSITCTLGIASKWGVLKPTFREIRQRHLHSITHRFPSEDSHSVVLSSVP